MKKVKLIAKLLLILLFVSVTGMLIYHRDLILRSFERGRSFDYVTTNKCESLETTNNVNLKNNTLDTIQDQILALKNKFKIPAINVCIAKDGEVILNKSFGCYNPVKQIPASDNSRYRIGSISKSLSAITLLSLVQEGKIKLSESVQNYIPDLALEKNISFAELAAHQSGIRHYEGLEFFSNKEFNNANESLSVFERDKLLFEPGTNYHYSTYNYCLIAAAIENLTGQEFSKYVETNTCEKLNMINTRPERSDDYLNFYTSNVKTGEVRRAIKVNNSGRLAGGGFLSNATDLVNMMLNLDSLLYPKYQKQLFTIKKFNNGEQGNHDYGLGFRITKLSKSNRTLIHHGGTSTGGRSFLLKIVEDDVIVAICTNSNSNLFFRPQSFDLQEVYNLVKPLIFN
ncbi:serine hydrolase domain-containing protein [Flagellimonas flava]|uniref:CubicO group peptidase, beta-lactamase class C family n=1 Tax=Flagellimonas flava TaxID=570519 RepID=A0A1M5PA58_9FLAO|nr:serine hydrolase domain-containing protein [Allomuricauda flava]SHG98133.1 CubicO group peptidase, beta-lactamase class C family [Allomuricauda flava]